MDLRIKQEAWLRKLKEKDARIRVIHHEQNKGLSEARNTGIQHATGRYIWFMDPDDTVDMDLFTNKWQIL